MSGMIFFCFYFYEPKLRKQKKIYLGRSSQWFNAPDIKY